MELTEIEREQIAELIKEGYTSGRTDSDDARVAWELKYEKWDD